METKKTKTKALVVLGWAAAGRGDEFMRIFMSRFFAWPSRFSANANDTFVDLDDITPSPLLYNSI